jgi:hypothetical protein
VVPESTLTGPELALQQLGKRRWALSLYIVDINPRFY